MHVRHHVGQHTNGDQLITAVDSTPVNVARTTCILSAQSTTEQQALYHQLGMPSQQYDQVLISTGHGLW